MKREGSMEDSDSKLIQNLIAHHGPRPWWKNPMILFGIWFLVHSVYFLGLGLLKADTLILRSSWIYLFFSLTGVLVSGFLFIHITRNVDLKLSHLVAWIIVFIFWILLALLIESQLMGTIMNTRTETMTYNDFNCFWHSVISAVGPILVFPIVFKHFFVSQPNWAISFMGIHLAFMGSLLTELKCPDRELWHLLLGHQTSFLGVVLLLVIVTYLRRKLISRNLIAL